MKEEEKFANNVVLEEKDFNKSYASKDSSNNLDDEDDNLGLSDSDSRLVEMFEEKYSD